MHFKALAITSLFSASFFVDALAKNDSDSDVGFYLGAGVARANINFKSNDSFDLGFEDTENAYTAKAGFMFTNWIGIEAGYYNFDEYENIADNVISDLNLSNADAQLDLDAFTGAIVLNLPLPYFDIYAKGGVVRLNADASVNALGESFTVSESRTEPFAVVGAEIDFGTINLYTEYTRVVDTDDLGIDLVTGGIKLEF